MERSRAKAKKQSTKSLKVVDCRNIPLDTDYSLGKIPIDVLRKYYQQAIIDEGCSTPSKIWGNASKCPSWWPKDVPFESVEQTKGSKRNRGVSRQQISDVVCAFVQHCKDLITSGCEPINVANENDLQVKSENVPSSPKKKCMQANTASLVTKVKRSNKEDDEHIENQALLSKSPRSNDTFKKDSRQNVEQKQVVIESSKRDAVKSNEGGMSGAIDNSVEGEIPSTEAKSLSPKNVENESKGTTPDKIIKGTTPDKIVRIIDTSPQQLLHSRVRGTSVANATNQQENDSKVGSVDSSEAADGASVTVEEFANELEAKTRQVEAASPSASSQLVSCEHCSVHRPRTDKWFKVENIFDDYGITVKTDLQKFLPDSIKLDDMSPDSCFCEECNDLLKAAAVMFMEFSSVKRKLLQRKSTDQHSEAVKLSPQKETHELQNSAVDTQLPTAQGQIPTIRISNVAGTAAEKSTVHVQKSPVKIKKLSVAKSMPAVETQKPIVEVQIPGLETKEPNVAAHISIEMEDLEPMVPPGVQEVGAGGTLLGQVIYIKTTDAQGRLVESLDARDLYKSGTSHVELVDMWTSLPIHQNHQLPHTDYNCHLCTMKCITTSALKLHVKMAHRKEQYICTYCENVLCTNIESLIKHMANDHRSDEMAKCNVCGSVKLADIIAHHVMSCHALQPCEICGAHILESQAELHKLINHMSCQQCGADKTQCECNKGNTDTPMDTADHSTTHTPERSPDQTPEKSPDVKANVASHDAEGPKTKPSPGPSVKLVAKKKHAQMVKDVDILEQLEEQGGTVIKTDNIDELLSAVSNSDQVLATLGGETYLVIAEDGEEVDGEAIQAAIDTGDTSSSMVEKKGDTHVVGVKMRDKIPRLSNFHEPICVRCEVVFSSQEELKDHVSQYHTKHGIASGEGYLCTECGKKLRTRYQLAEHQLIHSTKRPHVCKECGKSFKRASGLTVHIRGVHSKTSDYACPDCDKTFTCITYLRAHYKKIHNIANPKPYACTVCNKRFRSASGFMYHKSTHTTRSSHQCPKCFRVYISEGTLKAHMKMHNDGNGNGYRCEVCNTLFLSIYSLKKHKVIHERAPTMFCGKCNKNIPTERYASHMFFHRDFVTCKHCGETFKVLAELVQHERLMHAEVRPYICTTCSKSFRDKKSLRIHERRHAPAFKCDLCAHSFTTEKLLHSHMNRVHVARQHPYVCEICTKVFIRKHHYVNHLERHEPWQIARQKQMNEHQAKIRQELQAIEQVRSQQLAVEQHVAGEQVVDGSEVTSGGGSEVQVLKEAVEDEDYAEIEEDPMIELKVSEG